MKRLWKTSGRDVLLAIAIFVGSIYLFFLFLGVPIGSVVG